MPEEENDQTAEDLSAQDLQETPVSDAELLSALELDENLQPISATPKAQEKTPRPFQDKDHGAEVRSDSGENAESADTDNEDAEEGEEEEQEEEGEEKQDEDQEDEPEEEEEEEQAKPKAGIKEKMQRRIDKLTAIRKDLEAKLESAQPVTLAPSEEDPLSDLTSEEAVQERLAGIRKLRRWCLENLEGGEIVDSKGHSVDLSARQVRERLARSEDLIQHYGPQRLEYLRTLRSFDSVGRKAYPALYDSTSEESKIANNFLRLNPQILRLPNYQLIIGDAIRGMRARQAEETQAGKSGSKATGTSGGNGALKAAASGARPGPRFAPRAIKPGATARQQSAKGNAATTRLEREFLGTGDKNTLTALIASTL